VLRRVSRVHADNIRRCHEDDGCYYDYDYMHLSSPSELPDAVRLGYCVKVLVLVSVTVPVFAPMVSVTKAGLDMTLS